MEREHLVLSDFINCHLFLINDIPEQTNMIKSPSPSLASLLSPNLHGSEDGNDTILLQQALGAVLGATNHTTTASESSPMSTTCEMTEEEAFLTSVEKVTNTFASAGVTDETLELLVSNKCDERTIVEIMRDKSVDYVLETELKVENGLTRARIKIEVSKWATIPTSILPTTPEIDRYQTKIPFLKDPIPVIPGGERGRPLCSVATWKDYGIAMGCWLHLQSANQLAQVCQMIFTKPLTFLKGKNDSVANLCLTEPASILADQRWSNSLFTKATKDVIKIIGKQDKHLKWSQHFSGATMAATLGGIIMARTARQGVQALKDLISWPPVTKAEELTDGLCDLQSAIDLQEDNGATVTDEMKICSLDSLTGAIRNQARHRNDLAIWWALAERIPDPIEKLASIHNLLEQVIMDYPEQVKITREKAFGMRDKAKQICFFYRETGKCRRGDKCHFMHIELPSGDHMKLAECQNAAYKLGGECPDMNSCRCRHPNSRRVKALLLGGKGTLQMLSNPSETSQAGEQEQRRYPMRSTAGQAPTRYLDTTDYLKMIVEQGGAVPEEEMFAALEDSDLSDASIGSDHQAEGTNGGRQAHDSDWEPDIANGEPNLQNEIFVAEHLSIPDERSDTQSGTDEDKTWSTSDEHVTTSSNLDSEIDSEPELLTFQKVNFNVSDQPIGHLSQIDQTLAAEPSEDSGTETESLSSENPYALDAGHISCDTLLQVDCLTKDELESQETRTEQLPPEQAPEQPGSLIKEQSNDIQQNRSFEDSSTGNQGDDGNTDGRNDEQVDELATGLERICIQEFESKAADAERAHALLTTGPELQGGNGNRPSVLTLIDSGASRFMLGRSGMRYAFNVRPCEPVCFDTAQGDLVLDTVADAMLRDGTTIRDWLLNDKTDLNLFSPGLTGEGQDCSWKFGDISKTAATEILTEQGTIKAYKAGVLDYLPFELELVDPELPDTGIWPAQCGSCYPVAEKVDWAGHERSGHYPRIKGCDVCEKAFAQRAAAFSGSSTSKARRNTLNVDLLDWGEPDNNGNRYSCVGVVPGSHFPAIRQQATKPASITTDNVLQMKIEIETLSDPAGKHDYVIERIHSDQGSEFKGALIQECGRGSIGKTTGEEAHHTDSAVVENMNKMIQFTGTAIALTAMQGPEQAMAVHGELSNHVVDLIRLRSITEFQKEAGITSWQEQTLTEPDFGLRERCAWGSLAYGFIKKEDRPNKLSARAYKALFAGWDKTVKGAARLIPFDELADGSTVFHKTKVTRTFKVFDRVYPLKGSNESSLAEPSNLITADEMLSLEQAAAAGEGEEPESFEVGAILGASKYQDEAGIDRYEYHCRFEGYGPDEDLWISEEELSCDRMIAEYWERQTGPEETAMLLPERETGSLRVVRFVADGECANSMNGETDIAAMTARPKGAEERADSVKQSTAEGAQPEDEEATNDNMQALRPQTGGDAKRGEITWEEALKPEFRSKAIAGLERELQQMQQRRFLPTDSNSLSADEKKKALACRIVVTLKHPESDDWSIKCRLVAKDLKCKRKVDPVESYAGVPSLKAFRMLLAACGHKRISTADLVTAYLQQDDFDEGKKLLIKFWHPVKQEWVYVYIRGWIYGCIPAGAGWKKTFKEWMESIGFREIQNGESIYVSGYQQAQVDTGKEQVNNTVTACPPGVTVSCFVDDPAIFAETAEAEKWFHDALDARFDCKHHSYLSKTNPIEYCGTRLTINDEYEVKQDNVLFIERMLEEKHMTGCNGCKTPITKGTINRLAVAAQEQRYLEGDDTTCFRSGLGQLHWLASTTHPKLCPAHSMLASYTAKPVEGCLEAIKAACRYIAGAKYDCLTMQPDNHSGLVVCTDSDWAGEWGATGDVKSRSGGLVTLNNMPVDWWSAKQVSIATSSGDAESRALATGVGRGLQTQYLAEELQIPTSPQLRIWVDSSAAIGFARNNGGGSKMKHLDVRKEWIQQIRDKEQITISKIDGEHNPADFFTKIMGPTDFEKKSRGLNGTLRG